MSTQKDCYRTLPVAQGLPLLLPMMLAIFGCSSESSSHDTASPAVERNASAHLSRPLAVSASGPLLGGPISIPYLTDIDQVTDQAVAMRFGDGTVLVQKPASGAIEIIPTPEPDPKVARNGPAEAKSLTQVVPETVPLSAAVEISSGVDGPEDYRTWPAPDVALVVTGRQHGYIEPCGCTGLERQKGGVARRFTFLKELKEGGWNLLPIDAGDQVRRFGPQAEIKLQQTVRALKQMDYQAIAFGPDDLRLGVGELLSVAAGETAEETMYVSANVVLIDPTLVPQTKVLQRGEYRIGLTSLLDPQAMEVEPGEDISVNLLVDSARKAIEAFQAQRANFSVLLFFGTEEAAKKLAQQVAGFDLIVASGGYGEPTYRPESIEGTKTQLIYTGDKAMYAGLVGLYSGQPMKYARVALTHEFADAPEMRQLMADYQQQLKAIGLDGLGLLPPVPHSSGQKFVGTTACGKCHTQALDVWKSSAHAEATDHLVKPPQERGDVARHFDPECLSCHVTGWNPQEYFPYESGYLSLDSSRHLTGSGCENCHGPGSQHAAAEEPGSKVTADVRDQLREEMKLPFERAREKCMECHDLDNSPDFHEEDAFEEVYWPQVEHYGLD